MTHLADQLFKASDRIRYVASLVDGELELSERPGLPNASGADSDRYEELLVNPTVLELCRRRGEIDCGGLDFVLIRYGNFFQLVFEQPGGHMSVAIEPGAEVMAVVELVRRTVEPFEGG